MTWSCKDCVADALPFQKIRNAPFLRAISADEKQHHSIIDFNKSCSVCDKRVNNIEKAVPCYHCQSYIHIRKCSGLTEQDILNLGADAQQWLCPSCRDHVFPCTSVHAQDILSSNFNSNELCPCNDVTKDLTDYECLETITELNLDTLDLNHFHPNADNDIDQNLNLNANFKFYTKHEFHKLTKKLNSEHSPFFSLMHTNICSLNKNFENLELLTTSLEHKFDIIALSETWITNNNESNTENLTFQGYQKYTGTSGKSMKGGCGFFVSEELSSHPRED